MSPTLFVIKFRFSSPQSSYRITALHTVYFTVTLTLRTHDATQCKLVSSHAHQVNIGKCHITPCDHTHTLTISHRYSAFVHVMTSAYYLTVVTFNTVEHGLSGIISIFSMGDFNKYPVFQIWVCPYQSTDKN